MAYPSTLDTFNDPNSTDRLNNPSHSTLHQTVNTAVEALEAKVGVDSSAVNTTHTYKLSGVADGDKAASLTGTETLTNKRLNSPKINEDVAVTSSATELNLLDGVTATTTELNYVDTTVGTATASKAVVLDSNNDYSFGTGDITATIGTFTSISSNFPQGFLMNGKLSVTVSANDLIVAIKTSAGTDPSASDPVYCEIGDNIRSITGALSVTAADATNWFNSGSSELATLEVDYFAYLGYNATDGVVIGFARIPGARQYSNFSTTSTNALYCRISTITNAASTDYYQVIGRFAATLSAGAGYTWTVPTFTATNLINEPIFNTRWLTWAPTLVGFSSVPTNTVYRYKVEMEDVYIQYNEATNGTSNGTTFTFTLPFTGVTLTNYATAVSASAFDNGAQLTTPARLTIGSGSTSGSFAKDWAGGAWTNVNGKRCVAATTNYRYM